MPTNETAAVTNASIRFGTGWLPDIPDFRDYTPQSKEVKQLFKAVGKKGETTPDSVDLRQYCSPVEDQGQLGSCTANAVVGLIEYFERRAKGEYLDASRRFLYKVTRKLYHFTGDSGAYIRGTIRALRIFGTCPEEYWPYDVAKYDDEPPAFCYAFAQAYQAVTYYRIWDANPQNLLTQLKGSLAKGLPFAFGFTVYSSIWNPSVQKTGDIPFPQPGERVDGGHAIMAVGYDDSRSRFIIRNSWGPGWGQQGYGSLPYDYMLRGIADDFWVLTSAEYVSLMGIK
ncbi:MAG: C1 family peptidase [Terriglobia bacterium]